MHQVRRKQQFKRQFLQAIRTGFGHFPKHHTKILLGKFDAKLGIENIFRLSTGNKSLHGDNSDNVVGVVDFATSGCLWHNLSALKHS